MALRSCSRRCVGLFGAQKALAPRGRERNGSSAVAGITPGAVEMDPPVLLAAAPEDGPGPGGAGLVAKGALRQMVILALDQLPVVAHYTKEITA